MRNIAGSVFFGYALAVGFAIDCTVPGRRVSGVATAEDRTRVLRYHGDCDSAYELVYLFQDDYGRQEHYREHARFGETQPYLGHGSFSAVAQGTLPNGFEKHITPPPGVKWRAGTKVAVKSLRETVRVGEKSAEILPHEAEMMARVYPHDPEGLFVRGTYDQDSDSLITQFHEDFIPADKFLHYQRTDPKILRATSEYSSKHTSANTQKVRVQLEKALEILKKAGVVHSDLKPQNILINPETMQIKIIDFTLACDVGLRPAHLGGERAGNPRFASPRQQGNNPAEHADDVYSVEKVMGEFARAEGKAVQR